MKTSFVRTLSPQHQADIIALYEQTEVISIEQYPGFTQALEPDVAVRYLLAYRDQTLAGYACVKIKKKILATITFGPIVKDMGDYERICTALASACVSRGVLVLKILPPYMGSDGQGVIRSFTKLKFEQSEQDFNWATLKLSLDRPMEDILKGFSDNHRQSVKKAQRLNLTAEVISTESDIDIFSEQFIKMYETRGLPIVPDLVRLSFKNVFRFFRDHDAGAFLAVRSPADGIIGGVCFSYQGDSAFYYRGYSHPDHRSLPINHLAIYEAIRLAKEKGYKYFDFGGYGLNLKEDDQVHAINRFKAWFGGQLVYHPQSLTIYTTPVSKAIYNLYQRTRKK